MYDKFRLFIRESVEKVFESNNVNEENLEEERISNIDAAEKVKNKENFIGSHTYGEDLGGLEKMYVAYSYGEQHPLYMFYKGDWYHNMDDYTLESGEVNIWTKKHLRHLKPGNTNPRTNKWLQNTISRFKKVNGIGDNSHTDLEPGEK